MIGARRVVVAQAVLAVDRAALLARRRSSRHAVAGGARGARGRVVRSARGTRSARAVVACALLGGALAVLRVTWCHRLVLASSARRPRLTRAVAQVEVTRACRALGRPVRGTRGAHSTRAVVARALLGSALAVLRAARCHRLVLGICARCIITALTIRACSRRRGFVLFEWCARGQHVALPIAGGSWSLGFKLHSDVTLCCELALPIACVRRRHFLPLCATTHSEKRARSIR